jgi:uncharacterized protein
MHLLGIALAALIGLSLGLLGGGGSVLTVPILVYVVGMDVKQAIAASLLVVGTTSAVGAASHWRAGNVHLRAALVFGAIAMVGAYAGALVGVHIGAAVQLTVFAVVMLAAGVSMLRRRSMADSATSVRKLPWALTLAVALGVGGLTGMVGVGGGFLIVPALVLLARMEMRHAIGTSLLVIAMNAAAGFAGYAGRVEIAWLFLAAFTAVAIGGALAGARVARHVPQPVLRRAFGAFLMVIGVFILYQNRSIYLPGPERPPRGGAIEAPATAAAAGRSAASPTLPGCLPTTRAGCSRSARSPELPS